jgi:hypothetical protein
MFGFILQSPNSLLILLQETHSDVLTHSRSSSLQNVRESSRDKHILGGQK